ncbi:MAG: glycerol-3-phosphate dehydrogenase [Chloroflexi bacterium]|nr:MAG: glycerol-3-phosphate dehydrogenase [Chloroflexota bacterium]RLC83009.1 MAG: glycerol-3-phosphate dehydrogenase [Chloroflexota bacterium]
MAEIPPHRPFSAAARQENVARLGQEEFDLLIIGGGITGVAAARDAAMRGFRTVLIEKDDFGSGTSGRSSRLIHGGIRYLEYYQFKLVFESCSERRVMRHVAPRLVRPIPFLYPLYRGRKPAPWKMRAGLTLYDAMGLFQNVQNHRWLRPAEAQRREPLIAGQGLLGAARFYDAQVDDARLTLTTAKSAHLHGAVLVNHARVDGLMRGVEGQVIGTRVVDELDGLEVEARAKVVVNTAGVWVDTVREMDEHYDGAMTRPTQGVHLVIPRSRLSSQHAVAFDSPRDGRHVFLIPWGDFALIGATDTDYEGSLDNPAAILDDVEYLLEALRHAFPTAQIERDDVVSTFAGLRPLIYAPGAAYALSREHEIVESDSGLISVAGGKLTTHRLMGRQLIDRVQKRLAEKFDVHAASQCRTKEPLEGARIERVPASDVSGEAGKRLVDTYGADAAWVLAYAEENPILGERVAPGLPYLMAEVLYGVQHEMALTLCDVLIRRTHVIYETRGGGLEQARAVAELMASRLGWDDDEIERQVKAYAAQVALTQEWRVLS